MSRCWTCKDLTAGERHKICQLYSEERLSMKSIGIRFNLSEAAVRRVLRESTIPTRSSGRNGDKSHLETA